MPIVSSFKLRYLDGFLNGRLGDLQDSRVSRQLLKRSADLQTYTSTRYKNWNLTSGVTIFVNKQPVLSDDNKYTQTSGREALTIYDADGCVQQKIVSLNPSGSIKFAKPQKIDDSVEAEFSFRMVPQERLHNLLYEGLLHIQRGMYADFDPEHVPSAIADLVVSAALLKFYDSMNTDASLLYNYKVQDQMHNKSEVADNMRKTIASLTTGIDKDMKAALWRIGNGKARKVTSVKQRYIPSSSLRGYDGPNGDGV